MDKLSLELDRLEVLVAMGAKILVYGYCVVISLVHSGRRRQVLGKAGREMREESRGK